MATLVGKGKHTFEVIDDWAQVPAGWNPRMAAVTVDSKDRVYGLNRGEHPVIVLNKNGEFRHSWGEGMFAFPHAICADAQDNIWEYEFCHGAGGDSEGDVYFVQPRSSEMPNGRRVVEYVRTV